MADFPRQPEPVKVTISGTDAKDVIYWTTFLAKRCEHKGDDVQMGEGHHTTESSTKEFTIYPRAVND